MTLVAGACACALGASASSALAAYPTYYGSFYSTADEVYVSAFDVSGYGGPDPQEIQLVRDGSVIASNADQYPQIWLPAGSLRAGDQAVLLRNHVPVAMFSYDGTPTINADACAGVTQFTGAAGSGDLRSSSFTPANGSGIHHNVTVARTAAGYAATVDTPLATGDRLSVDLSSTTDTTSTDSFTEIKVAACPAAPVVPDPTPAPAPAPAPAPVQKPPPVTPTMMLGAVTGSLSKQVHYIQVIDGQILASQGATSVPTIFVSAGTMGYVWTAPVPPHAAAAAKTRSIVVARGSLTRKTPGTAKVKIRLTKAGKKLLRHSRSVKLTIRGTFTPVGGKPVTATKHVTIKRHVKKKHH
jgi:hypothetical protein